MSIYNNAIALLHGRESKKLANNTYALLGAGDDTERNVCIRLHDTNIITIHADDSITLTSGGWHSHTTKERLSTYLWQLTNTWRIYQEHSIWYLSNDKGQTYVYEDDMTLFPDGTATGAGEVSSIKEIQRKIKGYVKGYVNALLEGNVPSPSSGDCWYCSMQTQDGQSLGDATHSTDHLYTHFEEGYYVPSLLINADKFSPMCAFAKGAIAQLWQGSEPSAWEREIVESDAKRTLTKYLKHALGIAG